MHPPPRRAKARPPPGQPHPAPTVAPAAGGGGAIGAPAAARWPAPGGPLVAAATDDAIVRAWLSRAELSPRTARANGKEAERFLLWLRSQRKGLAAVRFEDLTGYSAFLCDPQPASAWVSATKWPRRDPRWRPFAGPLSTASHRKAMEAVRALFYWCAAAAYLSSNPAALLGRMQSEHAPQVQRFLPREGIALIYDACDRLPAGSALEARRKARARFLLRLLYMTGARLNEVASADMRSFRRDDASCWWFHVIGKGNKAGKMPVAPDLLAEFSRYRTAFGLPALPAPGEALPLLLTTRAAPGRATDGAVYNIVKCVMARAAQLALDGGNDELAARLAQGSTHWLRHSSFTHQLDAGVPLPTIQRNARHANLATTSRYLHKEDATRHAETLAALAHLAHHITPPGAKK